MERSPGVAGRFSALADPVILARLRRWFRRMNPGMVGLWRPGLGLLFGRWPTTAGTILVVEHTGRSSGRSYRAPVNYAEVGGEIVCVAEFGERTDRYRNLMASPDTVLWLPAGRHRARAEDGSARSDRLRLMRAVLTAGGFAAPAFGLHPRRMTDEEVERATAGYRLVGFRLGEPVPGPAADLAWVWLPAGLAVAAALQKRRRASVSTSRRPS
jgi:hypothetical protein